MVAMMWNSGCHSPALRLTATAASGTTWPSITTSCEPVPRMPSVRQLSCTFTCGEFIGMPKCSTCGGSPSVSSTAPVIIRSPAGEPDENTLRAVMR